MEAFGEDIDGVLDVPGAVGAADEACFVRGGGEVDAVPECVVEELFEGLSIARGGVGVVADGCFGEEEGKHGTGLGDLEGDAFFCGGFTEAAGDLCTHGVEVGIGIV